jgi:hypothetical protein
MISNGKENYRKVWRALLIIADVLYRGSIDRMICEPDTDARLRSERSHLAIYRTPNYETWR